MNSNEHKQLDQLLKDQLSGGSVPVPDFVWDRIEEELFPEKKRRGFFWWFFGAFCLLIMTVLFGIAFSGERVHSQSSTANTHILTNTSSTRTNTSIALKLNQTKGNSQYREHATSMKKIPDSRPDSYWDTNQKGEKKFSKFAVRNTFKSKSELHVSHKHPFSEKAASEDSIIYSNRSSLQQTDNNPIAQSTPEKQDDKTKSEVETKTDSIVEIDLSYEKILALIKRDFPESMPELDERKRNSFFSIGIYGGPSLYSTTVFKDYFTSGQLSNRTFASSGLELGLQARFKIGNRFRVYAGFSFNQKQTQFSYNLAITESDYFTYIANGEKVPFENIIDDGTNSCFLAKDVTARYQLQSTSISLGTTIEFLKIGKFSAAADLRLSCNAHSSLKLKEIRVLDIQQPNAERFTYLQPGLGLSLNYRLNRFISLGLVPSFNKQFYLKKSFSRKLNELLIPLTVSFDF